MYAKPYNVRLPRDYFMSDAINRKAIEDFIQSCEVLLSSSFKTEDFTKGECDMIGKYLAAMCRPERPWWWKACIERRVAR